MKKQSLTVQPYLYTNLKHQFSITFPQWWRRYILIVCPAFQNNEVFIKFMFRYAGKNYDPIFTIIISPFGKKEWQSRYEESPLAFIGEYKRHSYSYFLPEELPYTFLKPDKSDYDYKRFGNQIRRIKKMVNSVPVLIKSFRFIR
jgi:hypothetical protein